VLLEPVAGVEELPEPMPLPELAAPGVVGVLEAPPLLVELPMPELDAPVPALPLDALRASAWHLSRSAPVSPRHLPLTSLPDAPEAAPVVPDVLPEVEVLVSLELEDEAPDDGVVVLPEDEPAAGAVVVLPGEPMPVLPLLEPDDCENAAPDRARSAAAVAAVSVFNIMREISFEGE